MKIAHVEASNVVPSLMTSCLLKKVPKKIAGKSPKKRLTREPSQREW